MVHYGKGAARFKDGEIDERGMLGQDQLAFLLYNPYP